VTYWFAVGQLSCAVVSDGQMEPPLAPSLGAFFTPGTGVPDRDLREALAAEGQGRTMMKCGYNCLLVETPDGRAVIDTGLGARFGGYGPRIEPLVGRLGRLLAEAEATELSAVLFTHLHQDHARGATWSGELTFPGAAGFAHAAEVAFWSAQPSGMADALGSRRGAIGPQPPPSPGLGRRREPPRPRVPHAVSRTGPRRAARQRLPVEPSRLERLPQSPVSLDSRSDN
jgi:glyoxylase-like metal-dependent hydrolase (beta-lactamase superfamily II)